MGRAGRGLRGALPALLGVAVSVALLLWAAHGVDLSRVRTYVARAHLLPLLASVVVATVTFPLRLVRWRLLLRDDRGDPLPAGPLWHAVAIGFMSNNILPFRAGEVIRILTATQLANVRFTAAMSSVAVERIFDGLTVVALLTFALFASGLPAGTTIGGASVIQVTRAAGAVALAALLVAGFVVAFPLVAERLVRRAFSGQLADRVVHMIEGIRQGLTVLRSPGRLAGVVAWSLILWLVNALAFYLCFAAFDIPVPYVGALLLQGLLMLGIALPSTPGYAGPFEAAIIASLALYNIPKELALSYAVTFHITTFIPIILLGTWSLVRTPLQLRDLRRAAS